MSVMHPIDVFVSYSAVDSERVILIFTIEIRPIELYATAPTLIFWTN